MKEVKNNEITIELIEKEIEELAECNECIGNMPCPDFWEK